MGDENEGVGGGWGGREREMVFDTAIREDEERERRGIGRPENRGL